MQVKWNFNTGNFGWILVFISVTEPIIYKKKTGKLIQETEENKKK